MTKRTLRKKRNNRRERTKRRVTNRMKRKSYRKKSDKIAKKQKDAADANAYGAVEYAPPSGYLALCTKNLGSNGG